MLPIRSGPIAYAGTLYFDIDGGRYFAVDETTQSNETDWPYVSANGDADVGPWIDRTNSLVIFGTDGNDLDAFSLR